MVFEHEAEHPSRWAAIMSIAAKIGCVPQTLNEWVKKSEVDSGRKPGVTTDMAEKMKALERENSELRQANEILRVVAEPRFAWMPAYILPRRSSRARKAAMISFVDAYRDEHGVASKTRRRAGPICKVLPIAPSTYHDHAAKRRDPSKLSARAKRDAAAKPEVQRVFDENF
jgi:hypothetical protein